jgi:hypothetical protein
VLGIYDHLTHGLASEVCLIATIVASFQEASRVMQDRGVHIDAKKICEIARRYARREEINERATAIEKEEMYKVLVNQEEQLPV